MTKRGTTFYEAVSVVQHLSPLDKVRLMERLAVMLENELAVVAGEAVTEQTGVSTQAGTFRELVAWLDTNPAAEPWGDLSEDEDAAEYVHRMRRQTVVQLDDPGDMG